MSLNINHTEERLKCNSYFKKRTAGHVMCQMVTRRGAFKCAESLRFNFTQNRGNTEMTLKSTDLF